jgi:hypothetical protein
MWGKYYNGPNLCQLLLLYEGHKIKILIFE